MRDIEKAIELAGVPIEDIRDWGEGNNIVPKPDMATGTYLTSMLMQFIRGDARRSFEFGANLSTEQLATLLRGEYANFNWDYPKDGLNGR